VFENKQRLFPHTVLINWFLYKSYSRRVFTEWYELVKLDIC